MKVKTKLKCTHHKGVQLREGEFNIEYFLIQGQYSGFDIKCELRLVDDVRSS